MANDCLSYDCEGCDLYLSDYACMNASRGQMKERRMENALEFFESVRISCESHVHGLLVDGRIIFSPSTGKWRSSRKAKWYNSKGPEDLYLRFMSGDRPR